MIQEEEKREAPHYNAALFTAVQYTQQYIKVT